MFGRRRAAVLILRRGVHRLAAQRADLDADLPILRRHGKLPSLQARPLLLPDAHSQRARLGQDQPLQRRAVRRIAQHRQQRARPSLLHDHRRQHRVQRAPRQRRLRDIRQHLRRQVVQRSLHHGHRLAVRGVRLPPSRSPRPRSRAAHWESPSSSACPRRIRSAPRASPAAARRRARWRAAAPRPSASPAPAARAPNRLAARAAGRRSPAPAPGRSHARIPPSRPPR